MSQSCTPQWIVKTLALTAALALLLALPVAADGGESPSQLDPGGSGPNLEALTGDPEFADELWFVEFAGEPSARGGAVSAMAQERNDLRREARAAGIEFDQRYDFRRLWNGVSVRATSSEANALAELTSATAVYPVELIQAPEPQDDIEPLLGTALGMTGADAAGSELGFTGEGLSVAIVDTGIDYGHPDLGGDGPGTTFPTARVTHGFDYVGDSYNAGDPDNDVPQPNDDPMDINGHGTHVAGIVGADAASDDGVTGVAPGVTFGAYKVFGSTGSSTADVIIAALEDAHADGMDVINMSLGAGFAWGDYPTSQVSDQLVAEGTVVVASAGNSGADGVFSLGAPGNAESVISVASADNLSLNADVMEIEGLDVDGSDDMPYNAIGAAEEPPTEGTSDPIVHIGRACSSLGDELLDDPAGSTALIVRGDCTFEEKYNVAVDAGATAVLMFNNVPGMFAGGGIVPTEGVWAAGTTDVHGKAIVALLETEDEVTAEFTDRDMLVSNPTGGLISSFSSYGMTPDMNFRPDITAPGGLIESTYPLASGGYATISGTSMSAPHVAGGVALLLEAQPELDALEVRGVLQNSAEPMAWSGSPLYLDHSFRQGAGMMQIDRSITATTSVSPSRISLGEAETTTTTLELANTSDEAVTYVLSHGDAIGTAGFPPEPGDSMWFSIFAPGFVGATSDASFNTDTVTVEPGSTSSVEVTISNPDVGLYAHQAGGYLIATTEDGTTSVVPYAGLAGQIENIDVWPEARVADTGMANQLVAQMVENEAGEPVLVSVEEGHVFERGEQPVAALFMGFGAERVQVTARHVESGITTPVADVDFARRSVTPTEYIPYTWDGRMPLGNGNARRPAPRGEWVFDVRALMPRVDAGDPEVWVEDTSYSFEFKGGPPAQTPRPTPPGRPGGPNR